MSHASRFALIAALTLKGVNSVNASHKLAPVPSRCQGARVNLVDASLTPYEKARLARDVETMRAAERAAKPVNFVLVD